MNDGLKILVSEQVHVPGEKGKYEVAFRRWLVRELEAGRMTVGEIIQRFGFERHQGEYLLRYWDK